eukprot:g16295.t1
MGALSDLIAARAAAGTRTSQTIESTAIAFTSGNKSSKKLAGTRKDGGKKKSSAEQSSAKVDKKRTGNTAQALAQSKEKENEKQLAAALAAVRKFTQQRAELPPSAMLEQAGLEEAVLAGGGAGKKQGKKGSSTILAPGSVAPGTEGQERDEVERNERTLFVGNVPLSWTSKELKRFLVSALPSGVVETTIAPSDLHVSEKVNGELSLRSTSHCGDLVLACQFGSTTANGDDKAGDAGADSWITTVCSAPAASPAEDGRSAGCSAPAGKTASADDTQQNASMPSRAFHPHQENIATIRNRLAEISSEENQTVRVQIQLLLRIESIRFRSLPVEAKFVNNRRAAHATKAYADNAYSKNAYVVLRKEAKVLGEALVRELQSGSGSLGGGKKGPLFFDDEHRCNAELLVARANWKSDLCGEILNAGTYSRKKSVFLGNLPFQTTEMAIERSLQKYGKINRLRIVRDGVSRLSKGFGYVEFDDRASATKLVKTKEEVKINERVLRFEKVESVEELEKRKAENAANLGGNGGEKAMSLGKRVKQCGKKKALKTLTHQEQRRLVRSKKWLKSQKEKEKAGRSSAGKSKATVRKGDEKPGKARAADGGAKGGAKKKNGKGAAVKNKKSKK